MILKLRGLKFIEIYSVSVKCSKIRGLNFPPTVVEYPATRARERLPPVPRGRAPALSVKLALTMAPKRPATPKESDSKRSRKLVTIEKKLEVLDRYDRGEKTSVIVHATGLSDSTLRTIRANADKIRASSVAGTSASSSQCSRARSIEMERMEKLLAQWIQHENKDNVPISMAIIQTKALSIYKDLLEEDEEDKAKKFNASSGWFARFKKRHGFHNLKMTGEAASADVEAAKTYPATLKKIIEEGGYTSKQIFNIDETGLYWKKMPNRTYITAEEKTAPGFKASKDRLTLLFGANAEGDCKLKPALVYHSENPRALKVCTECMDVISHKTLENFAEIVNSRFFRAPKQKKIVSQTQSMVH